MIDTPAEGGPAASTVGGFDSSAVAWHGLSDRAITVWRLRATVGAAIALSATWLAAIAAAVIVTPLTTGVDASGPKLTTNRFLVLAALISVLIASAWVGAIATARLRHRHWRWTIDDRQLVVERGWWRRRRLQAPTDDVHTIAVRSGPILRHWSVHKLRVYASGPIGSVSLPVLDRDAVVFLRSALGVDDDE